MQGSTEFITLRPLVASSLCLGATKGLRVVNSVDIWVSKSNYYVKAIVLGVIYSVNL